MRRGFNRFDRRNSSAGLLGDLAMDALSKGILGDDLNLSDLSGGIRGSLKDAVRKCSASSEQIEIGCEAVHKGQALCESPIEKHILPWIVFHHWIFADGLIAPVEDDATSDNPVFVVCQAPVLHYRVDFLVCRHFKGQLHRVALECDGAAFHGGRADRKRDLDLLHERIFTIRAGGREIYERPWLPVARVEEAFLKLEECQ